MFGCALFVLFFRKVMELQTMLLLLGTPDQLRFVVFSLGCMNLYLLILSLGFDAPSPNRLLDVYKRQPGAGAGHEIDAVFDVGSAVIIRRHLDKPRSVQ